jgi:hypothetical protein
LILPRSLVICSANTFQSERSSIRTGHHDKIETGDARGCGSMRVYLRLLGFCLMLEIPLWAGRGVLGGAKVILILPSHDALTSGFASTRL